MAASSTRIPSRFLCRVSAAVYWVRARVDAGGERGQNATMTTGIRHDVGGRTIGLALAAALAGTPLAAQPAGPAPDGEWFNEVAAQAGIHFVHFNGMSGELYYPEIIGPGVALLDYDNDGDLDVYLVQGRMLGPEKTFAQAIFPPPPGSPSDDRLYRNDLVVRPDGSRVLHFTDVTEAAGIRTGGYGIGAATGDVDNDGWVDIYVTRYGSNQLWHNNGNGTFSDITARAGVDDPRLSVSATFFDFDRDGWLDLYVVNHVTFDLQTHKPCIGPLGSPEYCSTRMYPAVPGSLFRNRGDGSFEDVSKRSGITAAFGAGLGVVSADFNGDGWPDLYVANDGDPNQLWLNQRDGTFRDEALLAGAAVNLEGVALSGMGVDAGDFDGDGDEDIFVTNDTQQANSLYVNDGAGWFQECWPREPAVHRFWDWLDRLRQRRLAGPVRGQRRGAPHVRGEDHRRSLSPAANQPALRQPGRRALSGVDPGGGGGLSERRCRPGRGLWGH